MSERNPILPDSSRSHPLVSKSKSHAQPACRLHAQGEQADQTLGLWYKYEEKYYFVHINFGLGSRRFGGCKAFCALGFPNLSKKQGVMLPKFWTCKHYSLCLPRGRGYSGPIWPILTHFDPFRGLRVIFRPRWSKSRPEFGALHSTGPCKASPKACSDLIAVQKSHRKGLFRKHKRPRVKSTFGSS